jgi:hypothetical protein
MMPAMARAAASAGAGEQVVANNQVPLRIQVDETWMSTAAADSQLQPCINHP